MPMQTTPPAVTAPPTTCNAYQNLDVNSMVFGTAALPIGAATAGNYALLARSRALFYTAAAMYIIDREGGPACQSPATTREILRKAAELMSRQVYALRGDIIANPHHHDPSRSMLLVIRMGADRHGDSSLFLPIRSWHRVRSLRTEGRENLSRARDQLANYDALMKDVHRMADVSSVDLWLEATGSEKIWRKKHDDAFSQLCGWYELEFNSPKAPSFWERQLKTIGRFWSGESA